MSERACLGWSLVPFEVAPPWSVTSVSCELACRVGGAFAAVGPGDEIGDALSCGCLRARELLLLPLFEPLRNTLGMINKMHQLDVRLSGVFAKLMIISLEAARGHGGRGERV